MPQPIDLPLPAVDPIEVDAGDCWLDELLYTD